MTITIPDASALDVTGALSVGIWANLEPNTEDVHALVTKSGVLRMVVGVGDENNPGFRVEIGDGTNYVYSIEDPQVWIDDHWHFFALTFDDNNRARLYVDGNLTREDDSVNTILPTNAEDLLIGEDPGNSWILTGDVDDLRWWSEERTQTDIDNQRMVDLTGNEANLNGYWPMNDASTNTIEDQTPNGNDGTLDSTGEYVLRSTDNTDYFKSPTGEADVGLSQPTPCTVTNNDVYTAGDGTLSALVNISVPPLPRKAKYQRLLYRRSTSNEWQVAEDLTNFNNTRTVTIDGLAPEVTYEFATRSYSAVSTEYLTVQATNSPFEIDPKTQSPADVQNFTAEQRGQQVYFFWDAVPDQDLNRYEIRRREQGSTTSFENAEKEAESAGDTAAKSNPPTGTWEYMIKAFDTSGNPSQNAATVTLAKESQLVYLSDGSFVVPQGVSLVTVTGTGGGAGGAAGVTPTTGTAPDDGGTTTFGSVSIRGGIAPVVNSTGGQPSPYWGAQRGRGNGGHGGYSPFGDGGAGRSSPGNGGNGGTGAGGGGGCNNIYGTDIYGSGGSSAEVKINEAVQVTPGNTMPVQIGDGGNGGTGPDYNGGRGGDGILIIKY